MPKRRLRPTRLALEILESRDAPSATPLIIQSFDQTPNGWLPSGWAQWSNSGQASFGVSTDQALSGAKGMASNSSSGTTAAQAWFTTTEPADVQVSAAVYLNSLIPLQVLARGSNLATATPTYYAVAATRGMQVQLLKVVNGVTTTLATLNSATYVDNQWVQVTLNVNGTTVQAQVLRLDTGQYLNSSGQWQSAQAWALTKTDSAISGSGLVGLARPAKYAGEVSVDDFTAVAPDSPNPAFLQTFNQVSVGHLPAGWSQYSSDPSATFSASTVHALSDATGLAGSTKLSATDLAWLNTAMAANVDVSAAIYVTNGVPAEVFARGSNLNSNSPTYYAATVTQGLTVQLIRVQNGVTTQLGSISSAAWLTNQWVRVTLYATGGELRVQVVRLDTNQYLNSAGQWQTTQAWVLDKMDGTISSGGLVGLAKGAVAGTVYFDDFLAVNAAAIQAPPPTTGPVIAQHLPNIRIAELAYDGLTLGSFEDQLLKNDVDLVIPSTQYLAHISAVAPNTPTPIYTNLSNIYGSELTSWLNYAEQHGISPESAFLHVTQPTPFSGDSPASQPVDWFWGVYQGGSLPDLTDLTAAAHSTSGNVSFGTNGNALYLGYTDPFWQININLASKAGPGWSTVIQYPTAVDAFGNPTAWGTITPTFNGTAGYAHSGQILFTPPTNWVPALIGGTARLYYVRFLTVTNGTPPVASTILGQDYVNANGGTSGVIPVWNAALDTNHDGFLSNSELLNAGITPSQWSNYARFEYQSRLFYPNYGQMRYAVDPSSTAFRSWAVGYMKQLSNGLPQADGLFVDNSAGNPPAAGSAVSESLATYTKDYGSLLKAIGQAIGNRLVVANVDGTTASDPVVQAATAYFEEFAMRPLSANYMQFEDLAAIVAHRAAEQSPGQYAILDSYLKGGSATDARTQIATLAEYYLLANPHSSFLMYNGGASPSSSWTQHWSQAFTYNVGTPVGTWSAIATGTDPGNSSMTYRVYERKYTNALVLYKPLSGNSSGASGGLGGTTATTIPLGGSYRPLQANGTLGAAETSVTLRNGEGAILVKA